MEHKEKRTTIYLQNPELHKMIKKQAAEEGITINRLAERALHNYLVDIKKR